MFSFTLVQKIEAESERLAERIAGEIQRDPRFELMRSLDREELCRHARDLLGNLGQWLVARNHDIALWSESLGRARFQQNVPLNELIAALLIVKRRLIGFAREGMPATALQIYAEEELEYQVSNFFDDAIYHAAKGYESALRESHQTAAVRVHAANNRR